MGRKVIHGHARRHSSEYLAWHSMIQRCTNQKNPNWYRYGGRGITVCDRWRNFEFFLEDVGLKPSPLLTIERVNNNLGYEPGNVTWATRSQQAINRRSYNLASNIRVIPAGPKKPYPRYLLQFTVNGTNIRVGIFNSYEEALKVKAETKPCQ